MGIQLPGGIGPKYDAVGGDAMIELTLEQAQQLDSHPQPARVVDPRTRRVYLLVAEETYDRLRSGDEGPDDLQVGLMIEEAMREEDANDPTLAYYQKTYGKRP
jgi:hypothetical protein